MKNNRNKDVNSRCLDYEHKFLECVQDATFLKQNRYDIEIQRPHTNYYQEYHLNLFYRIYDITGGQETSLIISVNKILSSSYAFFHRNVCSLYMNSSTKNKTASRGKFFLKNLTKRKQIFYAY